MRSIDGALRMDGRDCSLSCEPERRQRVCNIRRDDGSRRDPRRTGFEIIDQFDRNRDDLFKVYEAYERYLQNENTSAFLRREGNLIIRGMKGGPEGFLNQWTYDLDKGGNLVEYVGRYSQQSAQEVWKTDYLLQGGAWVPTKISWKTFKDGKVIREDEAVFTNEVVNEPLERSVFSLESIGLRPGDGVSDQRTNLEYIYDGSVTDDKFMSSLKPARGIDAALDLPEEETLQPDTETQAPSAGEQPVTGSDRNVSNEERPGERQGGFLRYLLAIVLVVVVLAVIVLIHKRGNNRSHG